MKNKILDGLNYLVYPIHYFISAIRVTIYH